MPGDQSKRRYTSAIHSDSESEIRTETPSGWLRLIPLTVFDCRGIPATRCEQIEDAVEAGGKHAAESYEGWIAVDPFRGGVRVLITGPQGFERSVVFAIRAPVDVMVIDKVEKPSEN
jgi:hypothetical protein